MRRTGAAAIGVLVLAAGGSVSLVGTAAGEPGPPPPSQTRTVVAGVHTDLVAAFVDDGVLTLGSMADLPGGQARVDPDSAVFNVESALASTVPADPAYGFLGAAGAPVWVAPQVQVPDRLWPGFSAESIEPGVLDGDAVSFTLEQVSGPGAVEIYTTGTTGGAGAPVSRLFSGDPGAGLDPWTLDVPAHVHANWAFPAVGDYVLRFTATGTVAGQSQSASQDYTVRVGDVPVAVTTQTSVSAGSGKIAPDETVALTATVTPATATGWVEFLDGSTTLGHAAVSGGTASLLAGPLGLGTRQVTARYVPAWTDEFTGSISPTVPVTVIEPGAVPFGLSGMADRYTSGDILEVQVVGRTLAADERYEWVVAPEGEDDDYLLSELNPEAATGTLRREVSAAYDGWRLAAVAVRTVDGRNVYGDQTPYVPFVVDGPDRGSGEPITLDWIDQPYYADDVIEVSASSRPLGAGETYTWVTRSPLFYGTWGELWPFQIPTGANPWVFPANAINGYDVALQIRAADGTVLGQSAPVSPTVEWREVLLSGAQSVYRAGATISVTSEVYPAISDATYQWSLVDRSTWTTTPIEGATGPTIELAADASMDGLQLQLTVGRTNGTTYPSSASVPLRVSTAGPDEQLLFLASLSGHYHQGNTIALRAVADPAPADTDTYRWYWQRPDQAQEVLLEGVTTGSHDLVAEQALDGATVRTELLAADGTLIAASEPATIHVDDHGAPARQQVTIDGPTELAAGSTATLTASVSPATVLDRYQWFITRLGAAGPEPIEGATGAAYSFGVTTGLDGAQIGVSVVFDDGTTYVGAQTPVTLQVTGQDPDPEPEPTPDLSQTITATLGDDAGALVVSVDPQDRDVVMGPFALSDAGNRWQAGGELRPVTVTDTRSTRPGWNVSGQVGDFIGGSGGFGAEQLGWTPTVTGQAAEQAVEPGAPVAPGDTDGEGLSVSRGLVSAPAGAGLGTATAGGQLELHVPTDTRPGTYTALLTLTAI
ncbi:choice-of-anchor M domain-containing protein [Nakamurella leprariae]|uniref:Choice-of-anchor M domain-containing protein n=1 Tax=Nakamurella leprariae TaxID=2803911 RepID=A0A938YB87_9ACTN|nr:choice-of-anchor M domain-containing protein [Nakamurella leprariae]MBM9469336.1 choice-of-anchor M domain-containing protein [Nakamurella leprariae]